MTISASIGGKVVAFKAVNLTSTATFSTTLLSVLAKVGQYTLSYSYNGHANYAATTSTTTGAVTYGISALMLPKTTHGGTVALKLSLTDVFGVNVGSSATTVTATGIANASTPNTIASLPAGNVPTFTYWAEVYTLNLKTTGLAAGTYVVYLTALGDPVTHSVQSR